ncbi:class I adenylate-forming enzyme family protein [Bradyrhizobium sp. BWA-3-5]|uniref:class I adenylate-forming enzyme family protein n=1 Tax=Bradyrhizobium sp. BWA-3-5 TaxID=3080013 RepID=UPI00293F0EB0|nr:class I adenylate-forming enzyme family protein [Bradyrhizobium sp. BWA-3-5]WOH63946.1 class I adenylate-forming enzyme family protein [Bradyrhizobium sp. BWA-3-5]
MPRTNTARSQLQEDIANALRRIEALESAYETTTIGQLVSMRARTHGSATAIDIFERGERATYSEMDRFSNKYAHALRKLGVRKGDRIGVMLPNRIEFPILWFAFAKLGAVLVPVNMRYTAREIEYILGDTQAKFAIVDESAWPVFSAMDSWPRGLANERVVLVGQASAGAGTTLDELLKDVDDSPLDEDVQPGDLLNIQYTSGTTGAPKGCMLTHDYFGVASYQQAYRDLRPYKTYLSWSPLFYAYGQGVLLKSYRQGGTLYVAQQLSSTRCMDWVKKYQIEYCTLPELIAKSAEGPLTSLKQVAQYDPWSPETVRRFRERFGARGLDSYSSTEMAYALLPPDIEVMDDSGSVGIRAPLRALRLVKEDGAPAPVGEVGELWVSGRGIFKGYWNLPEADAAAFEGEWYKTGELLRCDELGFYWFVGRKKDMIRRSGENIAAGDIEAVIREIPAVLDVAAIPVPDAKRGDEVKICVELREGVTPDDRLVERILEHARARLAVFKVPRYIAFTPELPRNTNNKVLKRELLTVSNPLAGVYDAAEKRWH